MKKKKSMEGLKCVVCARTIGPQVNGKTLRPGLWSVDDQPVCDLCIHIEHPAGRNLSNVPQKCACGAEYVIVYHPNSKYYGISCPVCRRKKMRWDPRI